ncbi:resistance to inhibitors of cholinesterase protein 3 [Rhipicephalus sanguineus]|uniref:Resistance to inhibitors of cholinesterase protein 3 N-terminal domain-containing protein n=1 Tax=Rhipicephalus sanguineus TaxID=34632 RepID=A0A9D4SNG2_RHISA|nr:resistance to inhibitors of cholinesterase protein 3 [Rhipicephalus sanguineus]KAH7935822.1 hypothetical protein HPB52_014139 [Rhipicephalus sanguineus]
MANSDIGVGKSIAVLAIVVGCFTVLWPKVFYPMMQAAFSMTFSPQEGQDGLIPGRGAQSRMHEAMGQARPHNPEYARGRPFPHPSMRQPPRQAAKTGGTMNLVMPLYTIGVVVFFLYTVLKLVCKKPPPAAAQDSGSQEPWSRPDPRGTSGFGSPGHRVHPGDSSRQNPMSEVEELKRRLAQTEALLQQLLIRQSGGAQSASTSTNMSHSINLLVRELSKGTPQTPLRERHEGLRHRRPTHQTSEDEPACPCGAPLSSESCQGGSQPDSCSEGTAESGDEASLPLERDTAAY